MQAHSGRIDQWLQQSNDMRLALVQNFTGWYDGHPSTGRIMMQGDTASQAATGVRLVLERRPPGSWPAFLVVKAQPIYPPPPVTPPPPTPPTFP